MKQKWIDDFINIHYLHWKSDEFETESQTRALTRCNTDGGRDSVKDGKDNGGQNGEGGDLIQRQSALRDEDRSGGDNKTFDQILNDAIDNFSKSVAHHDSIFTRKKKTISQPYLSLKHAIFILVEMSSDKNTVIEDFLDEDTEIPGQRYVLLSFLSPEKVLDKKELYFFQKFLHAYEVDWKIKNLEKYMVDLVKNINDQLDERSKELEKNDQIASAEICRKNRLRLDDVLTQYGSFIQKNKADLNKTKIVEAYEDFMYNHKQKLEDEFYALNEFRTSIRGVKVRGVYGNPKEAEIKAKKLQSKDKYHNIFMGEVGKWTPWDPSPSEIKDQEYNNDQLNTLMKKYHENEDAREQFFEERTKGGKQVIGASTSGGSSAGQFDGMFGSQGDLALQRKLEKPIVTIEKVEEESSDAAEPQNSVVTPDA